MVLRGSFAALAGGESDNCVHVRKQRKRPIPSVHEVSAPDPAAGWCWFGATISAADGLDWFTLSTMPPIEDCDTKWRLHLLSASSVFPIALVFQCVCPPPPFARPAAAAASRRSRPLTERRAQDHPGADGEGDAGLPQHAHAALRPGYARYNLAWQRFVAEEEAI